MEKIVKSAIAVMSAFIALTFTSCHQELTELSTHSSTVSLFAWHDTWATRSKATSQQHGITSAEWNEVTASLDLTRSTNTLPDSSGILLTTRSTTTGTFYLALHGSCNWAYTLTEAEAASATVRSGIYDVYYIAGGTAQAADLPITPASVNADIVTGSATIDLTTDATATIATQHRTARVAIQIADVPQEVYSLTAEISGLYAAVTPRGEYLTAKELDALMESSGSSSASTELELDCIDDGIWESQEHYLLPSSGNITITLRATNEDATESVLTSTCNFALIPNTPYLLRSSYVSLSNPNLSYDTEAWQDQLDVDFDFDFDFDGNGGNNGDSENNGNSENNGENSENNGENNGTPTFTPGTFVQGTTILCVYHDDDNACTLFADLTPYTFQTLSNDHFLRAAKMVLTESSDGTNTANESTFPDFSYWLLPSDGTYPKKLIALLQSTPSLASYLDAIEGKIAALYNNIPYYYISGSVSKTGSSSTESIIFGVIEDE